MGQPNFKAALEETLTKAFACKEQTARTAYLQLADFYEEQAQRQALKDNRASVEIFR